MTAPPTPPSDPAQADQVEARAVADRYARRAADDPQGDRYHPLRAEVWLANQARQRALIALLNHHANKSLAEMDLLEVGAGHGDKLLELVQLGFDPARLVANELLPERVTVARRRLPAATRLFDGDALALPLPDAGFDLVMQSMVFSSLLDDAVQQRLADRMWRWLRPGGAVIWYDFTWNNPRNPDVRGVPLARLRALFPQGRIEARRTTLAPPLARAVVRVHPLLWRWLHALPPLRTHLLAWIHKPE